MGPPAGQAGDQPAVDGAGRSVRWEFGMIEKPAQLGRREVRVDDEARGLTNLVLSTCRLQAVAFGRRPAVLPDDGVVERLEALAIPGDDGLALIRDPDRLHLLR